MGTRALLLAAAGLALVLTWAAVAISPSAKNNSLLKDVGSFALTEEEDNDKT